MRVEGLVDLEDVVFDAAVQEEEEASLCFVQDLADGGRDQTAHDVYSDDAIVRVADGDRSEFRRMV